MFKQLYNKKSNRWRSRRHTGLKKIMNYDTLQTTDCTDDKKKNYFKHRKKKRF